MHDPNVVLRLLRRAVERGENVEIEGFGSFCRGPEGFEFVPESRLNVFIAYVEEDLAPARHVRDALHDAGFAPWLDKDQLLVGQNWPRAIERAIDLSDAFDEPTLFRDHDHLNARGVARLADQFLLPAVSSTR